MALMKLAVLPGGQLGGVESGSRKLYLRVAIRTV